MTEDFDLDLDWDERKDDTDFKTHMIAGSIAGLSEHIMILPIDNIKTHIQTTTPKISNALKEIKHHGI